MITPTIPAPTRRDRRAAGAVGKPNYRPEIQGLRSLAVLMVVSYHVWIGRVSGGVDVFLLISAFLMTLQFTRRYEQGRAMDLVRHWLHLFRRLLPAVVVVLLATLAATFAFLPATRWVDVVHQVWASLFYFENWLLQSLAVDYYAADHSLASPVQHFWSLSIQGQIFIMWPVIFAVVALLCRRFRLRYRACLAYVFAIIFAASLTYSIIFTAQNQAVAYFDTFARLWEFALGTLLALALPFLKLSQPVRIAMGWVGVAAMLSCGIVLQVQTAFPGFLALWPTLAATAVIAAGQTGSRWGADRILSSKFLVRLGDNSYALYLWHWPILVIALAWSGKSHAGWLSGTVIIATALTLAFVTTKFVEKPFRQWKWPEVKRRRALIAIVACLALVSGPLLGFQYKQLMDQRAAETQAFNDNPGAAALLPGYVNLVSAGAKTLPTAAQLPKDWANLGGSCQGTSKPSDKLLQANCQQNDVGDDATKSIVVLGDSHAQQWMGALAPLAQAEHWKVTSLLLGGCRTMPETPAASAECNTFNAAALKYVEANKPSAVFMVGTDASPSSPNEQLVDGFAQTVKTFNDLGVQVVAIRDNPRYNFNVTECALSKGADNAACKSKETNVLAPQSPFAAVQGSFANAAFLDMTDLVCDGVECSPVVGNMFVYLDDNHLSKTYVASMGDTFNARWFAATGWQQ
ncbi:acyltransferase family protein [Arthrobacter sp. efr-133-TYG-104]|uniref:acyltransferase family protein n=1 Tax=Arthrobacter sp. efr-133-TYG-104 TaxID=3040324 RepID=UPI00254CAC1B|nr:acyltransferase family protein [Arthrobacter sp. efr-133-TYG-104]